MFLMLRAAFKVEDWPWMSSFSTQKRHLITEKSAFFLTDAVAKQAEIVSL